jgi:putative oxidoreductase
VYPALTPIAFSKELAGNGFYFPSGSVAQAGIFGCPQKSLIAEGENVMLRKTLDWLLNPPESAPRSTILIRLMAGGVFLSEGILKFVYVNQGVGRFTKLGIPAPDPTAHFVAVLEIVGGLLIMSGLLTRLIAIPFIIEMIVAILSTKVSLFLGTSPLPLPPAPPQIGIWAVLHETRSDYAQIMSVLFLLAAGPGPWSLDALLARAPWHHRTARLGSELPAVSSLVRQH